MSSAPPDGCCLTGPGDSRGSGAASCRSDSLTQCASAPRGNPFCIHVRCNDERNSYRRLVALQPGWKRPTSSRRTRMSNTMVGGSLRAHSLTEFELVPEIAAFGLTGREIGQLMRGVRLCHCVNLAPDRRLHRQPGSEGRAGSPALTPVLPAEPTIPHADAAALPSEPVHKT
jgi:hypothetical protein